MVTGAVGALAGPGDVVEVSAVSMRVGVPMDAFADILLGVLTIIGVDVLVDANADAF